MSLRTRVLLGMACIAVVLVGMGVVVARTTQAYLVDQVDAQLRNVPLPRIPVVAFPSESSGTEAPPPSTGQSGTERPSPLYLGVVLGDEVETVFAPDFGVDGSSIPDVDADQARAAAGRAPFTTAARSGSGRFRVRAVAEPSEGTVFVQALPLESTDEAVARLVWVEVVATVAILGVLALVAWWVVRLGVRPIKKMAHTATLIAGGDLSQRVPELDPRTEAGELGSALNAMLGNIEEAFDERTRAEARLRQFLADASHELRTPVTTIRGYAELYRAGGLDEPGEVAEAMRRTEQESVRMGALVDDMMELARLDQGRPLAHEPVDLADLARDAARDARAVDPGRPIEVETEGPVVVQGDGHQLHQVVANLVGNALAHTEPGTPVGIRTGRARDEVFLEVIDAGPGMAPDVAARVFERFYRADPSRSRRRGGAGLGLSIVAAVVEAHGGRVELDTAQARGTTVRVLLPSA